MKLSDLRQISAQLPAQVAAQDPQALQQLLRQMGYDPDNLYQELEMSSRYVDTHRDTSYTNSQVQLHSHTFFELLYCRTSCGAEYLVGTERYRLQQGDIVFVPPGISHRPLLPESMATPYERYVVWISLEFARHFSFLFPDADSREFPGVLRTAGTRWESLEALFRAGVREAERREAGWEAAVVGNTITLLTQLGRAAVNDVARPMQAEQPELPDRIASYIEQHYAQPITVRELARRFYVSDSTVSHLFKRRMGVSICRYITQRRLITAKSLIVQGLGLEDVGRQVGFADYSTFYRAFRQEYGISPRQYRKLQQSQL